MKKKGRETWWIRLIKETKRKKQTDVDIRERFFFVVVVHDRRIFKKVSKREKKPRPRKEKGLYEELLSRIADDSSKQPLLHWFTG